MTIYDHDSFSKDVLPGHLKKDERELIDAAVALGWKCHVATSGVACTLISHDEAKKIHIGKRSSIPLKRMMSDVVRYGRSDLVNKAATVVSAPTEELGVAAMIAADLPVLDSTTVQMEEDPVVREAMEEITVEESVSSTETQRRIISEAPMLARGGSDRGYESKTTVVRKWSDGSVDYKCRYPDCDYVSTARLGTGRHFGQAHTGKGKGLAPRNPSYKVDVLDATSYQPRQTRVEALSALIQKLMDDGDYYTSEEIARLALTWMHEQSSGGTDFAAEREPLSAEETLNRIRVLLDNGEFNEQQKRLTAAEERILELEQQADEAKAAAERARSTLKAFTDLASELAGEEAAG